MQSDRYSPDDGKLSSCAWCSAEMGENALPAKSAAVFCSRRCEIEANFWLYAEMCAIEITHPTHSDDDCDDYYERP
jgi:hypothetical protein